MDILTLQFALFVIVSVVIYHSLPTKWKSTWLLIISYGFYAVIDIRFVLVLFILTTINYLLVVKTKTGKNYPRFLSAALLINLFSFGFLKWFSSPYGAILGFASESWILPVGFSFYILQLISFQLAFRHFKENEIPSFWDFALYLVYFPKLLSGPIEKPNSFLQKIKKPVLVTNEFVNRAFGLIFNGLIRKVVIANLLRILVPSLFDIGSKPTWVSLFAFSILLYNDFAGYTSVVRGVSLFFGIELSPNFLQPYLSRNFSEFWSHWHISLSVWLRETIYFPLSRKLARINTKTGNMLGYAVPPVITMVLSGLWHGAILAMLTWGFLHGLLLILERLIYEKWPASRPNRLNYGWQMVSRLVTFMLVSFGWVLFASPGFRQAIGAIRELFLNPVFVEKISLSIPLILIFLSFLMDFAEHKQGDELWWQKTAILPKAIGISFFLLVLTSAILFQNQEPMQPFIYQGF